MYFIRLGKWIRGRVFFRLLPSNLFDFSDASPLGQSRVCRDSAEAVSKAAFERRQPRIAAKQAQKLNRE
jgi:hypothetical protein